MNTSNDISVTGIEKKQDCNPQLNPRSPLEIPLPGVRREFSNITLQFLCYMNHYSRLTRLQLWVKKT